MKYRVKKIDSGCGIRYIPQYTHFGLIWSYWYRNYSDGFSIKASYKTMDEAKKLIQRKCKKEVITYTNIECDDYERKI